MNGLYRSCMRAVSSILCVYRIVRKAGLCSSVILLTVLRCHAEPVSTTTPKQTRPTAPVIGPLSSLSELIQRAGNGERHSTESLLNKLQSAGDLANTVVTTEICAQANRIGGDSGALHFACREALIRDSNHVVSFSTLYQLKVEGKAISQATLNLLTGEDRARMLDYVKSCIKENYFCLNSSQASEPKLERYPRDGVTLGSLLALVHGQSEEDALKFLAANGSVHYHNENMQDMYELLAKIEFETLLAHPESRVRDAAQRIILSLMKYEVLIQRLPDFNAEQKDRRESEHMEYPHKNGGDTSAPDPRCRSHERQKFIDSVLASAGLTTTQKERWLLDQWLEKFFCERLKRGPPSVETIRGLCANPMLLGVLALIMSVEANPPDPKGGFTRWTDNLTSILDRYEEAIRNGESVVVSAARGSVSTLGGTVESLLNGALYPVPVIDSTFDLTLEFIRQCGSRIAFGEGSPVEYHRARADNQPTIEAAQAVAKFLLSLASANPAPTGPLARLFQRFRVTPPLAGIIAKGTTTLVMQVSGCLGAYLKRDDPGSEQEQLKHTMDMNDYMQSCLRDRIGSNFAVRVIMGGYPDWMSSLIDISDTALDINNVVQGSGGDALGEFKKIMVGKNPDGKPVAAFFFEGMAIVLDLTDASDGEI